MIVLDNTSLLKWIGKYRPTTTWSQAKYSKKICKFTMKNWRGSKYSLSDLRTAATTKPMDQLITVANSKLKNISLNKSVRQISKETT